MPNKNIAYTEIKKRSIYVLVFPSIKSVYIGQTIFGNVRAEYNRHMLRKIAKTRDYTKERPCLFVPETVNDTKVKTYHFQIVWSKVFKDRGYKILDKNLNEYSNNLTDDNYKKYQERKDKEFNCQDCIVKNKCAKGEFR